MQQSIQCHSKSWAYKKTKLLQAPKLNLYVAPLISNTTSLASIEAQLPFLDLEPNDFDQESMDVVIP